jgi:hypothetical protein
MQFPWNMFLSFYLGALWTLYIIRQQQVVATQLKEWILGVNIYIYNMENICIFSSSLKHLFLVSSCSQLTTTHKQVGSSHTPVLDLYIGLVSSNGVFSILPIW